LSLAPAWSIRQRAALDSKHAAAVHIVDSMTALLNDHDFVGVQSLIEETSKQFSQLTPGAGESYKESLNKAINSIEGGVEQKIKDGQSATQVKIENEIEKYETANEGAIETKGVATRTDTQYYQCVERERADAQEVEKAEARLREAVSAEGKACQLQQDNRGFKFSPEVQRGFKCDLGVDGQCSKERASFDAGLKQHGDEAHKDLGAMRAKYQQLKADCDQKKAESKSAESALGKAKSALASQGDKCRGLLQQRNAEVCGFSSAMEAKCLEEDQFKATIAATEEKDGDMHSEIDRKHEWMAAFTTKCMLGKAVAKGLNDPVTVQDLNDCKEMAKYSENVGELKTYAEKAAALTQSNACTERKVEFYNGKQWIVPTHEGATSADYKLEEYRPLLGGKAGFAFCGNRK